MGHLSRSPPRWDSMMWKFVCYSPIYYSSRLTFDYRSTAHTGVSKSEKVALFPFTCRLRSTIPDRKQLRNPRATTLKCRSDMTSIALLPFRKHGLAAVCTITRGLCSLTLKYTSPDRSQEGFAVQQYRNTPAVVCFFSSMEKDEAVPVA